MRKQKGFATIGVALMILAIVSINSFIGIKGSVLEQKSSNNAYYSEKSFQHAELGLNKVRSNINQYLIDNPTVTSLSNIPTNMTNLTVQNVYSTVMNGNQLISTGYVNGVGLRKVTQIIGITAGTGGPAALSVLGSVTLGGSTSATNVKAGGTVTGNLPAQYTASTNEFKIALLDHNGQVLKDSLGNIIYRSMTANEYFLYYFGGLCPTAKAAYDGGDLTSAANCKAEAKASVAANPKGYICNAVDCSTNTEDANITAVYNIGKRIFWLENGGINHSQSLGTQADPVLVFVMNIPDASKAAKINASSTYFGVLYVDVLDVQTTIGCSCSADAVITNLVTQQTYVDDLTKPIYTLVSSGGQKCNSNSGCKDSLGTIIPKNSRYVTTYQQKTSSSSTAKVYGNFSNLALNTPSPSVCTINACSTAVATADKTCSGGSVVNDIGKCSFVATAVSGTNNTAVQVTINGTWDASGTGNSTVQGAVLTSGNYQGTGNAAYIYNSTAITNIVFGQIGGAGFTTTPTSVSVSAWSDMN
jgi:Tfp pilus assembly protein PilX